MPLAWSVSSFRRASRRHVFVGRHHGWGGERTGSPALSQCGWGELLMLGVGRGEWWTLRPASGVSGPHRLRRTLAPEPSSTSLLHSATRALTSTPSSWRLLRPSSCALDPTRHTTRPDDDPTTTTSSVFTRLQQRQLRQRQLRLAPSSLDFNDPEPPCACAFIDRGRSVYVNFRIKSRLEAGPRHPMFSHWSGKKGA